MRECVFPNRIVAFVGVENQENLLIKKPLQIGLAETKTTLFDKNSYIILENDEIFLKDIDGNEIDKIKI